MKIGSKDLLANSLMFFNKGMQPLNIHIAPNLLRRLIVLEHVSALVDLKELFSFSPDNLTIAGSDTRVNQPDYSNKIVIEVDVEQLDKEVVLSKARSAMNTTRSLINQVNPQAQQWSVGKEPVIDDALQKEKRAYRFLRQINTKAPHNAGLRYFRIYVGVSL
jgi:hypothetical protein